jgi:hypothetical protein
VEMTGAMSCRPVSMSVRGHRSIWDEANECLTGAILSHISNRLVTVPSLRGGREPPQSAHYPSGNDRHFVACPISEILLAN